MRRERDGRGLGLVWDGDGWVGWNGCLTRLTRKGGHRHEFFLGGVSRLSQLAILTWNGYLITMFDSRVESVKADKMNGERIEDVVRLDHALPLLG